MVEERLGGGGNERGTGGGNDVRNSGLLHGGMMWDEMDD